MVRRCNFFTQNPWGVHMHSPPTPACRTAGILASNAVYVVHNSDNSGRRRLSRTGLRVLRLTILLAWLTNFVAAYGLARSTAAYGGGLGVYYSIACHGNISSVNVFTCGTAC